MIPKETPIKVIQSHHPGSHPSETRIFAREIHEHFCMDPKCKFYNQHTQQGICHTRKPHLGPDHAHVEAAIKEGEQALNEVKRMYKGKNNKKYIDHLEGDYAMHWTNEMFHMDHMIYLRKELAIAKAKLRIEKKKHHGTKKISTRN